MHDADDYLTEDDLCKISGAKRRTLQLWRQLRYGPPFLKIGRKVIYPGPGYREWVKANSIGGTHRA